MRWLKSPSPSLCAPSRSAVIGMIMRRASSVPARIATISPMPIRSAMRTSWSRIGIRACVLGCSNSTLQPSFGTVLAALITDWPLKSVPELSGSRLGVIAAATCGSFDRSLPTSGPLDDVASTRPRGSTT